MTYVGPIGYPDWERIVTQVTQPLVRVRNVHVHGTQSYGPFFVGPFTTLKLTCAPLTSTRQVFVIARWAADHTFTEGLYTVTWKTFGELPIYDSVGNVGTWLILTVICTTTTGTTVTMFVATLSAGTAPSNRVTPSPIMAAAIGTPLPAHSSHAATVGFVTTGPASFTLTATEPTVFASVVGLTKTTPAFPLVYMTPTTLKNQSTVSFYLPAQPVEIQLSNSGTATATVGYSLLVP